LAEDDLGEEHESLNDFEDLQVHGMFSSSKDLSILPPQVSSVYPPFVKDIRMLKISIWLFSCASSIGVFPQESFEILAPFFNNHFTVLT
jgi:hypothetical protein